MTGAGAPARSCAMWPLAGSYFAVGHEVGLPDRREPWRVPAPVGKSSNYISSLLLGRPQRHLTQVAGSTERREAGSTERREAGSTTRREAGANQLQACSCPYRKNRQAPAGPRNSAVWRKFAPRSKRI